MPVTSASDWTNCSPTERQQHQAEDEADLAPETDQYRRWALGLSAEKALLRERERGHEPDPRSWAAIAVARRYADGEASKVELAAAGHAAGAAAWDAAWDAEIEWQRQRFDELVLSKLLKEVLPC